MVLRFLTAIITNDPTNDWAKEAIVTTMLTTLLLGSVARAADPCPIQNTGPNEDSAISSVVSSTSNTLAALPTAFKSDQELVAFFKQTDVIASENYAKKYATVVDQAAAKFQIPAAFLACILNSESSFVANKVGIVIDPKTKQEVPAKDAYGIAQFTQDTLQTIDNIIAMRKSSTSPDGIVASMWANFGNLPRRLSSADLLANPDAMIAASALFYKLQALSIFGEMNSINLSVAQLKILAAGYNWGPEHITHYCGDTIEDPDACLATLEKIKQIPTRTKNYMTVMAKCVLPSDAASH